MLSGGSLSLVGVFAEAYQQRKTNFGIIHNPMERSS